MHGCNKSGALSCTIWLEVVKTRYLSSVVPALFLISWFNICVYIQFLSLGNHRRLLKYHILRLALEESHSILYTSGNSCLVWAVEENQFMQSHTTCIHTHGVVGMASLYKTCSVFVLVCSH